MQLSSEGIALACAGPSSSSASLSWSPSGRYLVALANRTDSLIAATPGGEIAHFHELVDARGVDVAARMFDGVSCAAIWDRVACALTLLRDPMGEGDLYYRLDSSGLVFGSELSTIMQVHGSGEPCREAVAHLLQFGYIPAPLTVFQGVGKLAAGTYRVFTGRKEHGAPREGAGVTRYWNLREVAQEEIDARRSQPLQQSVAQVESVLSSAIARRSRFGASVLLSGGVDSSLIAALASRTLASSLETFTVAFDDPGHDEAVWATRVADHLGVHNERLLVGEHNALELVRQLPSIYCEPFADSSQIPMALTAAAMGNAPPIAMTGDGGDELFFGHGAYSRALRNHGMAARLPRFAQAFAQDRCLRDPEQARMGGLAAIWAEASCVDLADSYLSRVSRWRSPSRLLGQTCPQPWPFDEDDLAFSCGGGHSGRGEELGFIDQSLELPEGLLTKADRALGAYGLQSRSPFLDPELVKLAWRLPFDHKFDGRVQKLVLKRALEQHLPFGLVHRKKKGFGAPIARWLQGPLRDWAEDHLAQSALRQHGLFDEAMVLDKWRRFKAGERKWHTHLWPILMFQAWYAEWGNLTARSSRP